MDTRSLRIQNSPADLTALANNRYNLQVAKSVIKNDQRRFFIHILNIYHAHPILSDLQCDMEVGSFGTEYDYQVETNLRPQLDHGEFKDNTNCPYLTQITAQDVPASGLSINLGGYWKQCDPGQVLDLDANGVWTQSTSKPIIDYLAVGKNNYKSGTPTNGIHIVIGVQLAPGEFDTIFIDQTELGPGMNAAYQPQEKVQWWYEAGMKSATMISSDRSSVETGDFSAPDPLTNTYSLTSSYSFANGVWTTKAP